MTHQPRPFDQFLKKLPELQGVQLEWNHQQQRLFESRARLDKPTLRHLEQAGLRLDPWQKQVLQRHPAFRNLRQDPSFLRLTHQTTIRPRSLLRRLLRRLRVR